MNVKMWDSEITRSEFQQTIDKLHQIRNIPHEPRENIMKAVSEASHCLSLLEEEAITSKLAFISATSAKALEVTAVCFEEDSSGNGATIRIASNTGVPSQMLSGFKKLADILMGAYRRKGSRIENTEDVFHQVVDMDFCRILSRLRSRHVHGQIHPRKISKCGLFDLLNRSLGDPSIRPHSNLSKAGLASLKRSASELGILFDRFELIADINTQKYDACSLVKQMVSLSYEMTKSGILATALRSSKLDPSIIASLPEALGKVGKYYSISCELISAARQRSKHIFQNIKVEPVSVSKPSNVGGKVHAEIQLLFFYERNLALLKPRVICSSKSACYLCNVFFEIHGIFFMPRTHGKLYSKWILPDWLETSEAQQQHLRSCLGLLKATLDNEISKASKAQTRRLSDPNESVLLPSTYWKSSSTVADQMLSPNSSTSTIRHLPSIMVNPAADGVLPPTPPLTPPDRPIGRSRVSSFSHNQMSSEAPPHVKPNELRNVKASPSSSSIRSIDVSHDQFPYSQLLTATISALYLNLEGLCLNFEFTKVVSGQLLIERFVSNGSLQPGIVTNLEDIPTTEELQMPSFDDNDTLIFHLEDPFQRQIRLTIVLTELS